MPDPAISILIPLYRPGAQFRNCLEQLLRQKSSQLFEIVLMDSGGGDLETCCGSLIRDARIRRYAVAPGTFGHGRTRNEAARVSLGQILVFLVQDAEPRGRDWLQTLTASLAGRRLDAAYCRQIPRAGADLLTRRNLNAWMTASPEERVSHLAEPSDLDGMSAWDQYRFCYFDNVASCMTREAWQRVPFPDVDFGEDVAWAKKALSQGMTLGYEPRAAVFHSHDRGAGYLYRRYAVNHAMLYDLFGLEMMPDLSTALRCSAAAMRESFGYVARQKAPLSIKIRSFRRIPMRAFAEAFGPYRGLSLARSGRRPSGRGI